MNDLVITHDSGTHNFCDIISVKGTPENAILTIHKGRYITDEEMQEWIKCSQEEVEHIQSKNQTMTKQELLENYTMEQLADMVVDLQKENLIEILKLKNREDTKDVQKVFDAMRLTITELCNTIENLKAERDELKNKIQSTELVLRDKVALLKAFQGMRQENIESKTLADFLPTESIKVADMLINASKKQINCMTEKEYDKHIFEKWQLRQIAEHLLVYCNANESEGE